MKKLITIILCIVLLSGCAIVNAPKDELYFGDYEKEELYQEIIKIENCNNPDELKKMLEAIYDDEITYISLEYGESKEKFKEPYEEFLFEVLSIYPEEKNEKISQDAYAFFKGDGEVPEFIMDSEHAYIVEAYEVETLGEKEYLHKVSAYSASELYLCLHGYAACDGDEEKREELKSIASEMDSYNVFELMLGF